MKKYLKSPEEVIDALVAGKVVCDKESQWKLHKGFIVRKDEDFDIWIVNDCISSNYAGLYIDEPEPLKLEVGKFYKTREGGKVIILADINGGKFFVAEISRWTSPYTVRKNGCVYENGANAYDIIAPWQE